ncbi:24988_t:CDS:2, partial [Dentiscutata erythropus]
MTEIRNILLVGSTGKGKSALANVITETNEFEESTNRIRGTEEPKSEEFVHEGTKYRIIDTVGIGDSTRSAGEILSKLEEKADIISEAKLFFDDKITDFTTIVCTNFSDFEDYEACEKDRKIFREETEKFSKQLSRTVIIYVDNPPAKGRYLQISKGSREASRKILLTHLKTCQEIYRPELLAKFSKMVDEFNSILEEINKATINVDFHLNNCINYLKEIIIKREKVIEMIEERKEEVKEYMKQRGFVSTLGHSAILCGKALTISGFWFPLVFVPGVILSTSGWLTVTGSDSASIVKENDAYRIFEKCLAEDEVKSKMLENSQIMLNEAVGKFKEIDFRFNNLEYRKHEIDRKKIDVVKEGLATVRAAVEAFCKIVPSPLSFYCIYRDRMEAENRTSVEDMETAIKNWNESLITFKEKEQPLNIEYEKISWCKVEMAKLLPTTIEIPNPAVYKSVTVSSNKDLVIRSAKPIEIKTWENWNGAIHISPKAIFKPSTLEDLIYINYLVIVTNLNQITIQKHGWTVTAEAGTSLYDLDKALRNHDPPLTLDSETVPDIVRVSGVITVGAHGGKISSGTMSDQLCSMKIVTGSGEVCEFNDEISKSEFNAAK